MSGKFLIQPGFDRVAYNINQKLNGYVPNERTINGKPLSADVTLTASDVGAITASQLDVAIRTNIRTKWKSGWPDVWYNPIADTGRANLARVSLTEN